MLAKPTEDPWWRSNLLAFVLSVVFAISASYMTAIRTGAEERVSVAMKIAALEAWQVDAVLERRVFGQTVGRIAENQILIGTALNTLLRSKGLREVDIHRYSQ